MKNIVVIGGGTGTFTVLSSLKKYPQLHLSAIVSMADDGGSTGKLRDELGVLPPGDVRRGLVALSKSDKLMRDLINYRFKDGCLGGHNFGNLLISVLEKITGDFTKAIMKAGEILAIRGQVIPVTCDKTRLCAELENGKIIKGETNIDIPKHDGRLRIKRVFLRPQTRATGEALKAIKEAHLIVIGPGDLYTSILPNLLVKGICRAIAQSRAKKIYLCNLMTKFGETNGFKAIDFVKAIENYLGKNILDIIVYNNHFPSQKRLAKYFKLNSQVVKFNKKDFENLHLRFIGANLITEKGLIRHNQEKLAKTILKLI